MHWIFNNKSTLFRFKKINRPTRILIYTDSLFFSGIAMVDAIFGVFIVEQISGATVANLGVGTALYTLGILLSEPIFSNYYDRDKSDGTAFYGYITGNAFKSLIRLSFIFITTVNAYYLLYFLLGVVHSIAYPSFSKVFMYHIERGKESIAWGYKDFLFSLCSILALSVSGYIALTFGFKFLFILSAMLLMMSGVIYPLINRKAILEDVRSN